MPLLGIDFEGNDGGIELLCFCNKKVRIGSGTSGVVIKD